MKTAIITGASTGIGMATARRFLDVDYRVLNLSRRPCSIAGVDNMVGDLVASCRTEAFTSALQRYVRAADAVVLIHNACLHDGDTVQSLSDARLAAVLTLNIQVPNTLNRILIPHMLPGSAILYLGSTLSEKAVPGAFSYILSKHALVGMMRATTQDLVDTGIHAVCVCPGFTDTEMLRHHVAEDARMLQRVTARSSEARLIQPEEIADTLFFAACSPVLNGAVIHAALGQRES